MFKCFHYIALEDCEEFMARICEKNTLCISCFNQKKNREREREKKKCVSSLPLSTTPIGFYNV